MAGWSIRPCGREGRLDGVRIEVKEPLGCGDAHEIMSHTWLATDDPDALRQLKEGL